MSEPIILAKSVQFNIRADPQIVAAIRKDAQWKIKGRTINPADVFNAALRDFFASWCDEERYRYYVRELERRTPKAPDED